LPTTIDATADSAQSAERPICLTVRLPSAQHDRLSDLAWSERTSMSEVVRELIAERLAAAEEKRAA